MGKLFLSPIDVVFTDGDVYHPDILFILEANKHVIEETKINGVPDMIVVVFPPSNAYYDLVIKNKINTIRWLNLVRPNNKC